MKEASRALVELANSRGGHDNTTVILISVPADFKLIGRRNVNWLVWVIGGLIGIFLVFAAASVLALGLWQWSIDPTPTPTSTATITRTPPPAFTATPRVTLPALPTLSLPIAPTYTPWPTNTGAP
jgi:hypothetical protein